MRGKDNEAVLMDAVFRITPAYAGKSFTLKQRPFEFGDHPRVCGEKTKKIP